MSWYFSWWIAILLSERWNDLTRKCVEELASQNTSVSTRSPSRSVTSQFIIKTITILSIRYHEITNFYPIIYFSMLCGPLTLKHRPPLWPRGNIATSHAAGPGSILGRSIFSGVFFSTVRQINVRKFRPHSSLGIIWPACIMQTIFIRLRTGTTMGGSRGDIKWRTCDVGEAKEGLGNELWRMWSNGRIGEWAVT